MVKVTVIRSRMNPKNREQWLADYQEKHYQHKFWGPGDPEPWELLWDMVMEELRWWTDHVSRGHIIMPSDRRTISELGLKLADIEAKQLEGVRIESLDLAFTVRY